MAAHFARVELLAGALEKVVVFQIPAHGFEICVLGFCGFLVRIAVGVVFEFGGAEGFEALLLCVLELLLEDVAGGDVYAGDVAVDEGCFLLPRKNFQRVQIGDEMKVTVAEFPVGEFVAGSGLHFHIGGEEIIADVCAIVGDGLEEEIGVESLAHQPPVGIGEGGDHGVDGAHLHLLFEFANFGLVVEAVF